ncbi:interferon-induced protein 44-like [Colossoma macropomum]|uniref:interferon-induced protein 44-like n=1 Tax=Colossoma macropomum TaxID=42526 RepID=UPI001863D3E2|nr:interferon-induced protein 44-like [Colossoma macropomum]
MGFFMSKPEFVTVLADKHVKIGEDIKLSCKANAEELMATWEKNGQKVDCVEGKITMKTGKSFDLEIKNAEEGDEGKYTVILKNKRSNVSCSAMVTVELNEWRTVEWNQDGMIDALKAFKISNEKVGALHFLLYGPTGAGKSSIINTIKTIFKGRLFISCLAASEKSDTSFTKCYEKTEIEKDGLLPFTFHDIRGLEKEDKDGVHTQDIISALKGHVKEGYMFKPTKLTDDNQYYIKNPSLNDKIHCLVNVIPADTISMIKDDFIQNMKKVREEASNMGLPQVIFMTRVDRVCPRTKKDLRSIYKSKKIKEKIRECSMSLGVPMNCIFPVWNYHEETEIKEEINCLMLHALTKIVHWADDYIVKCSNKQTSFKK